MRTHWALRKSRVSKQTIKGRKMDYTEVFNSETEKLSELRLLPATGLTEEDNLRIIESIKARIEQMELAIKELRVRRHRDEDALKEHLEQLPKHKQQQLAESDMKQRQKKVVEKIDKQVQIKKAQAAAIIKAMEIGGFTPDEIKAHLQKKALL